MSLFPLGLISQGGGGSANNNALTLISTTVLSSATNLVTISSIPGTYKHLQLRVVAKSASGGYDTGGFYVNSDTTAANYATHGLNGSGSSVSSFGIAGSIPLLGYYQIAGATNTFGGAIIDILDYANTSKYKTTRTLSGHKEGASSQQIALSSGLWLNTGAITSITFKNWGGSNYDVGSRFSLYGVS